MRKKMDDPTTVSQYLKSRMEQMEAVTSRIPHEIEALLDDQEDDLQRAWEHVGEGESFVYSITVKLFRKGDIIAGDLKTSFVVERCKSEVSFEVGRQLNLFESKRKEGQPDEKPEKSDCGE